MNLFGGGGRPTSMRPHPEHILRPPQNKSQAPANPADILKKNDILMYSTKPMNYIESVKENGFHLSNNFLITSPRKNDNNAIVGLLLLHSETFEVDLKTSKDDSTLVIENDWYVKLGDDVLNVFKLVHPKPEILVIGLGKKSRMLSIENRDFFSKLGIQLEISDSNNAAQIFDLLATERPNVIGALLLPPNL
ncbi:Ndufaf3 NADH dehydrogenase [ubiquinone] 1 alpha subcomplex assembly factor 3 [Candida maltosa Xu316]